MEGEPDVQKYAPTLTWTPDGRTRRVVCGMCPDVELSPSIAGAKAHLLAHPNHIIAVVATTTTLLSIGDPPDTFVQTPIPLPVPAALHE